MVTEWAPGAALWLIKSFRSNSVSYQALQAFIYVLLLPFIENHALYGAGLQYNKLFHALLYFYRPSYCSVDAATCTVQYVCRDYREEWIKSIL